MTTTLGATSQVTPDGPGDDTSSFPAQPLVEAILALSGGLGLRSVLTRLVEAAASLTQAQYGALGVLGNDGTLSEFISTGIDERAHDAVGKQSPGGGLLGLLIDQPGDRRVDDLSAPPTAVGAQPGHPVRSVLRVPIRIRGTVFGTVYLTEKAEQRTFTARDEVLVQALATAAGVVIENARAYGLSERRRQWLEASAELTEAVQPPVGLEEALKGIVRRARATSGATLAAIVQFPPGLHPVISACDGVPEWEAAALVRRVVTEARDAEDRSLVLEVDLGGGYALVLPLRAHLAGPGSLVVVFDGPPTAGHEEHELIADFVEQAGLALDRAQAVADREQLAVVSERERTARDLHDVVIQRLFAAGLKLRAIRSTADPAEIQAWVDSVVDDLDLTIKDIRATVFVLRQ